MGLCVRKCVCLYLCLCIVQTCRIKVTDLFLGTSQGWTCPSSLFFFGPFGLWFLVCCSFHFAPAFCNKSHIILSIIFLHSLLFSLFKCVCKTWTKPGVFFLSIFMNQAANFQLTYTVFQRLYILAHFPQWLKRAEMFFFTVNFPFKKQCKGGISISIANFVESEVCVVLILP